MSDFPVEFCRLFPGLEKVPIFDLSGRTGETGYIDFLLPGETGHMFVKGVDRFHRKFFTYDHGQGVATLFQRYTDNPNYWAFGGTLPAGIWKDGGITFTGYKPDVRVEYLRKAYLQ